MAAGRIHTATRAVCPAAILAIAIACTQIALADESGLPTFADDIAPIVYENCVICHNPDGVGPFSLIGYEQVRKRSRAIAEVVESGFMPPWKPKMGVGPRLRNARGLEASEIAKIQRWAASGAKAGDLSKVPPAPEIPKSWTIGEPDLVLEFAEPYTLPADGIDIYRNFVIPVEIPKFRYVKAVEFLPQTRLAIHHAIIFMDDGSWARERDAEDETPGFGEMNLSGLSNPEESIFIGWAPGSIAHEAYPGTEWKLSSRVDFIVQLHLLPTGKPENINPKIGIYYSDKEPTKVSTFLLLSSSEIDIPAGEADYLVRETIQLPIQTHVLGVFPHAHYLGKDMKIFANLPGGARQDLLWIPDWDFNWQTDYRFEQPLTLPADSTLVMEYTYDNSPDNLRNPFSPPRNVKLGFKSTDEMGEVAVQMIVNSSEDLAKLDEALVDYMIEQEGGFAPYLYKQAQDYQVAGDLEQAEKMLRASLKEDRAQPQVSVALGNLLEDQGRAQEAEIEYRSVLADDPSNIEIKLNLARVLFESRGDTWGALELTEEILENTPSHFKAGIRQSHILANQNRPVAALRMLASIAKAHPDESYPQLLLGQLHHARGGRIAAEAALERAAKGEFQNVQSRDYAEDSVIRASAFFSLALIAQERNDVGAFKENLQGTLRFDPKHSEALLFSAALAYLEDDRERAESFLERLLALAIGQGAPISQILALVPFPEGPEAIVGIHIQAGRHAAAREAIDAATAIAKEQNRSDLVSRFAALAQDYGL